MITGRTIHSRSRPATLVLAGLALVVLAACQAPRSGSRRLAAGTPIVLISIDTLRADRLPIYGYSAGATPAIDALRRDSVLFENAYSHVPLTLPSHTSIFTGMLPPEHGVRDNLGVKIDRVDEPSLPPP